MDVCNIRGHSLSCEMQRKLCKSHFFLSDNNSPRPPMRKIEPPYIKYMYLPTCLQELAHIISFLLYNTLKIMCVSGYPTVPNFLLTPPPPPPLPLPFLLKNFPVRQYPTASQSAKATYDMGGGTSMLVLFLEHCLDQSMKSTCMEPHMSWYRPCWYL